MGKKGSEKDKKKKKENKRKKVKRKKKDKDTRIHGEIFFLSFFSSFLNELSFLAILDDINDRELATEDFSV